MEPNNEQRPNAALINKEWFESAATALQRDDLCDVLFSAVTYVLYGDMPEGLNTAAEIVFTMIRPALDSDIVKYRERCARNAANARSGRERVVASGTQSQPVGAITTTTPTTTTTTTQISLRESRTEIEIEREKWLVFGHFWSIGSKAVTEEMTAFWSYYESLGWKNNKGAAIVDKLACARMWRCQFETGSAPNGAKGWFSAIKGCKIPDFSCWTCYVGAENKEDSIVVRLKCTEDFLGKLLKAIPDLERTLQRVWKTPQVVFQASGSSHPAAS